MTLNDKIRPKMNSSLRKTEVLVLIKHAFERDDCIDDIEYIYFNSALMHPIYPPLFPITHIVYSDNKKYIVKLTLNGSQFLNLLTKFGLETNNLNELHRLFPNVSHIKENNDLNYTLENIE
jgi:hypothetical protein